MSEPVETERNQKATEPAELLREKRRLATESKNAQFLRRAFGASLILTYACIFLQGFGILGFHLTEQFLNWLGGATIGQTAGLFAMVLRQK